MYEATYCLLAAAAIELRDRPAAARCRSALLPASGELAGAGSGMVTVGPVDRWLHDLEAL
ncbi:hypothetical protein [Actinospica robiniae]|uniref:hypothetical protein n=1 Tax=Actinospica robiniae TaxID=304901 RepID=UPI000420133F|nr:hypothetical protein [Actinospica robiniae]